MITRKLRDFSLSKIAGSGQCFRMQEVSAGVFRLVAFGRVLKAEEDGAGRFLFSCTEEEFRAVWEDYFDLSADYGALPDLVPEEDRFLRAALAYGRGMRILRQDPWEVTASFIISQRKNIPAIRAAVEALCAHYGEPVAEGGTVYFSFPSAEKIAGLDCAGLRSCSLGYRDKYVIEAARRVAAGDIRWDELRKADYETAGEVLRSIYGVGKKVADCIQLFGLHHTDAFPEDTWIRRIIESEYGGNFPRERYAGYLGIVQQYMFFYARSPEYRQTGPLNRP